MTRSSQESGSMISATKDLEASEHTVTLIDDEIEVLTRTIRQLQFRKTQHLDRIKYFKGLTTLARRILPEILAGIIEECVRDGWTRMPLTVSHVCPEWRRAVKIPAIWSHIYVNCDAKDPCGRTRFWLQNAQMSPLNITVDVTNDASRIPSVMELLLTRAAQWQTLTITSSLLSRANYILELCNRPLTDLHTLNISVSEEFDDNVDQAALDLDVMDVFEYSPRLRMLCIDRNILPSSTTVSPQITHLAISLPNFHTPTKLSVDRALTLLEALSALQELSIPVPYLQEREFEEAGDESRLVGLPDLSTLIFAGSPNLFRILPHLSTPSLFNLHLRSSVGPSGYPDPEISSNFRKYIETTMPPLELLDLHDIDLTPTNFAACLARLPHLRDLRLHESDISDSVIDLLAQPEGFCPCLVRVDFRWCGQITGGALVRLVHNRFAYSLHVDHGGTQKSQPIGHVTVINCSFVKEEDLLEMSKSTVCRVMVQAGDYCGPFGCCRNERYRKRLHQRGLLREEGTLRPPRKMN